MIHSFGCRQKDSLIFIPFIDKELDPWRNTDYVFKADNGGVGQALIDDLRALKWRVQRTNNNSPAFNKAEFLNLGAEMYFHTKRLLARKDIIPPKVAKLKEQLTTRKFDGEESKQGKFALQNKKVAIAEGSCSPDRADAYVLTFASYHANIQKVEEKKEEDEKQYTISELLDLERKGLLFVRRERPITTSYHRMIKV